MNREAVTNRKDILLLMLYSPGKTDQKNEPMSGRTRLVKALYLFRREVLPHFKQGTEITEQNFYEFFPWHFGPFSAEVYDDLAFFILNKFVELRSSAEEPMEASSAEWQAWITGMGADGLDPEEQTYVEEQFRLTHKGVEFVEKKLWPSLSSAQIGLLKEFKKKVQSPLRAILRYVYSTYPESIEKSQIKDEVLSESAWMH